MGGLVLTPLERVAVCLPGDAWTIERIRFLALPPNVFCFPAVLRGPGGRPLRLVPAAAALVPICWVLAVVLGSKMTVEIEEATTGSSFSASVVTASMFAAVSFIKLGSSSITVLLLAALSTGSGQFMYYQVTSLSSSRISACVVATGCFENSHSCKFFPSCVLGVLGDKGIGAGGTSCRDVSFSLTLHCI